MYESQMEGRRNRGKLYTWWLDKVENARNTMLLELDNAKVTYVDAKQWRDFVNGTNNDASV